MGHIGMLAIVRAFQDGDLNQMSLLAAADDHQTNHD